MNLSLYLVTNDIGDEEKFLNIIEDAIKGGVTIVQLREKTADTLDFYNLAQKVKDITLKYDVPLIINDRVDIALAVDADGVHVGQSDMPCSVVRKIIGDEKIIGVSAHNVSEAVKAQRDGADHLGSGAVFTTQTKSDMVDIPVVAIGGINHENAHELNGSGIAGLSVVSAIMSSDNPYKSATKLLEIFNQ